MITFLILLAVGGLFVGALGRLLLPGRDPMSIGMTILVGIASMLISGLIAQAVVGRNGGSFIFSVLVAMGIVYLIRRSRAGRGVGGRAGGPLASRR